MKHYLLILFNGFEYSEKGECVGFNPTFYISCPEIYSF